MKPTSPVALVAGLLWLACSHFAFAGTGFATRDLNPVLQPYFLPSHIPTRADNGWRIDHSLFITNTFQQKTTSNEDLIIDVENYRYELGMTYRRDQWQALVKLPFIANSAGSLDGLIGDWHDFFGLPEGRRDKFPADQLKIEYTLDGVVEYSQTRSSSGLGDTVVALGYQSVGGTVYFAGIELPTGSAADFSGNEAVDFALWLSREVAIDTEMTVFGMFGISFPGDDGNLEGLIADHIWVAQLGLGYRFNDYLAGTVQLDMHSKTVERSDLKPFGNSLQVQLGLGFLKLIDNHRLDLFFSEDIAVGTAPDISFGLRLAREF
ncbi:MAG: DUF3187 family protein [Gammaproteobacteria bacterium]|nr:DUF3187 family protein [Gammaproteobacteria bacterium]MDH3448735.1 DUF3187 family protein [Gammaproteobacteria bacterium]